MTHPLQNARGSISTEFLFSFFVSLGLLLVVFSLSYTLTVMEVTQYVVFSASRAHLASNLDSRRQQQAAKDKFKKLTEGTSLIAQLYQNGWFTVSETKALDIRSGESDTQSPKKNFSEDLAGGREADKRHWFLGVSSTFQSNIMNFKVPFLGSGSDDEDGFKTRLNAMLIREPSQEDCQKFIDDRGAAIKQLPSASGNANFFKLNKYVPLEDNGC